MAVIYMCGTGNVTFFILNTTMGKDDRNETI
jgi:hypothetical protein